MFLDQEPFARAQHSARLHEAAQRRADHQLVRVHRATRKAEKAARQARAALARAL